MSDTFLYVNILHRTVIPSSVSVSAKPRSGFSGSPYFDNITPQIYYDNILCEKPRNCNYITKNYVSKNYIRFISRSPKQLTKHPFTHFQLTKHPFVGGLSVSADATATKMQSGYTEKTTNKKICYLSQITDELRPCTFGRCQCDFSQHNLTGSSIPPHKITNDYTGEFISYWRTHKII